MLFPVTTLFLALACHTVLCQPGIQRSLSIEEEYMEENIDETEPQLKHQWIKNNADKIVELFADVIGGSLDAAKVPGGSLVSTILKAPLLAIPKADKLDGIQSEMNALNMRLDNFYEELKWASNDFQQVLNVIDNAWLKYQMVKANKDALKKTFFPFYSHYVDSVLILHNLLISNPERMTQSLADVLAKRFRCHEKDLEAQFLYVRKLIRRGNEMDEKYYVFVGVDAGLRKNKSKQILEESNQAFFTTHQRCVSNSELYVKRDVIERIDDKKLHKDIANNIDTFLREKYDRYDWLVFAFTTHFTKKPAKFMKRHLFSGFTEIERGTVTVAVASQVRGKYEKTQEIKDRIETALDGVLCTNVEKKLTESKLMADITAVHIHRKPNEKADAPKKEKADASTNEDDNDSFNPWNLPIDAATNENDDEPGESFMSSKVGNNKYIHNGKCGIKIKNKTISIQMQNQYTIMIKSDEERANNLCSTLKCLNGGTCEVAPRTNVPMCKCPSLFYGRACQYNSSFLVIDTGNRNQ